MKQIKTIVRAVADMAAFDIAVNNHLADGWQLRKREIINLPTDPSEAFNATVFPALYAEMERETPPFPEEVTA